MGRVTRSAHLGTTISQGADKTKALERTIQTLPGSNILYGAGAPPSSVGTNGQLYVQEDGAALTTIYQKRSGVWVGIV
jgi:hypothetical protein